MNVRRRPGRPGPRWAALGWGFVAVSVASCSSTVGLASPTGRSPHRPAVRARPVSTVPARPAPVPVLIGKVVVIDPGHNGDNYTAPAVINQLVWNGREEEACDTTGTETAAGYTEAQFNWQVAQDLAFDLGLEGAKVIMTRTSNTGVGPCVTERAAIGNLAHADAAVSIHADGGPVSGRGFAVLEPVADGINDRIVAPSQVLGTDLRDAFAAGTGMPVSTYDGVNGIEPRDDLAGLNLSTVPKVLIECGNMQNPTDAALLVDPAWQQRAAASLATGLTAFLTASAGPG